MTGFALRRNMAFDWNGTKYRIDRLPTNEDVLLERVEDGQFSVVRRDQLLAEYGQGHISAAPLASAGDAACEIFSRPLEDLPAPIRQAFERRRHYLQTILDAGKPAFTKAYLRPLILMAAGQIGDDNPPDETTVYRWYRRFQASLDTRALIPRTDRRGSRDLKQDGPVLSLMSSAIEEAFKVSPQATGRNIYTRLIASIDKENRGRLPTQQMKPPSLSTVYRMLARVEAYDRLSLRDGKAAADKRFRIVKAGVKTEHILERVEIDHTPLDLFLIDERTWLPLGRPTLTVVIDHFSRMLLGFHLSFDNPSTAAVIGALRHAILPKRPVAEAMPGMKTEHKWNCYGRPDVLVVDNGLEFHGNDLESVAYDLGIRIQFCPKHQPRFKGVVERYLKTINYFFAHQLPGTSFARLHQRGDYDPQKHALLTFAEFNHLFEKWVVDVYSQTLHRGIGTTPWAKWAEGQTRREPDLPTNLRTLQRRIGQVSERALRQDGIQLNGIRYNGDALGPILRAFGVGIQVRVLYDPEDLGEIQVWGPDDTEPVAVQALDQSYASGLTVRQNNLIRSLLREQGATKEDRTSLERARHELSRSVGELMSSRKQRDRRRAATILGISSSKQEESLSQSAKLTKSPQSPSKTIPSVGRDSQLPLPLVLPAFQLKRANGGQP
ncbi:Mu transposase C-terminal domain-containing protein [Pandoraea cepalis]|uniref:Integrase catalytic subunit n=1 Tax=Pandoraea cepalis TaxID=2508294 RepID=A0A5E4RDB6_9BURK|nr:DDE-type integrase/transposase/recombinase [Pandoraea cepalis]VVD60791.1 integrase catalytic subunit [Pandoraea cepalis]